MTARKFILSGQECDKDKIIDYPQLWVALDRFGIGFDRVNWDSGSNGVLFIYF